jgi:hypothetical protein
MTDVLYYSSALRLMEALFHRAWQQHWSVQRLTAELQLINHATFDTNRLLRKPWLSTTATLLLTAPQT